MQTYAATPLPYSDSVEVPLPNEDELTTEIAASMQRLASQVAQRDGHAVRSVHAKSHGLLKAEFRVYDNLPKPLAQGLFAAPATYPAIVRLSTVPGEILDDSVSTLRGMAIKIIGVPGQMLPNHAGHVTQDFVLTNGKTFPLPDLNAMLAQQHLLEAQINLPQSVKKIASTGARLLNSALAAVGQESEILDAAGHPATHILGDSFHSLAAFRYGNYIAKLSVVPVSEGLYSRTGEHLPVFGHPNALREAVVEFFATHSAQWEVRVQLCVDLERTPVENPSIEWPESLTPFIGVARITARPQNAYSEPRRIYVDEQLTFSPWHALAAHRPLGNIMRGRLKAYAASSAFRHHVNAQPPAEPTTINDLPD